MNRGAPIVVGVDGSAPALSAVRWAAREAVLRTRPLHLLSVMPDEASTFGGAVKLGAPRFPDQRTVGRERLSTARSEALLSAATLGDRELQIVDKLRFGSGVEVLLDESRTAAMLVVGSHGLNQFADAILGSVSAAVVLHSNVPVAVIRNVPNSKQPQMSGPIVVGIDGTENSEPAIAEAYETASIHGVELTAVHAWSDSDLTTVFRSDPDGVSLDWDTISTAEHAVLAERLAGWRQEYPDVAVRCVVVRDNPARQLEIESKSARLVLLGRRGRGGFSSMLLGSTSRRLMHTASCPLLIMPSPTRQKDQNT